MMGGVAGFSGLNTGRLWRTLLRAERMKTSSLWAHAHCTPRNDEECVIWNRFMTKAGWRDDRSARLQHLVVEYGFAERPIETIFDLFDYDEGRDPITERPWL